MVLSDTKIIVGMALFISTLEMCAQTCIKKTCDKTARKLQLCIPMALYACIVFILYSSYEYEDMGRMNLIWSCISIIFAFVIGYGVFGEPFNKFTMIAILLAISSVFVANIARKEL